MQLDKKDRRAQTKSFKTGPYNTLSLYGVHNLTSKLTKYQGQIIKHGCNLPIEFYSNYNRII